MVNERKLSPLKAIRHNCIDCMGGNKAEVRRCPSEDCSLFRYRFGRNPSRSRFKVDNNQDDKKVEEDTINAETHIERGIEPK